MTQFADRVQENTSTTGTGTITFSGAVAGYRTFAAGFPDRPVIVGYGISDGNNWEVGTGILNSAGDQLVRDVVHSSSESGNLINLSGSAKVFSTDSADNIKRSNIGRQLALINGWAMP